ncbi:hypothetical protein ACOME3_003993 [Neoechinorhynchus agilis]
MRCTHFTSKDQVQKVLNPNGGRLGAFCPCIEQCQEFVGRLYDSRDDGILFTDVSTSELLNHSMELKRVEQFQCFTEDSSKNAKTEKTVTYSLMRNPEAVGHRGYMVFATFVGK